MRKRGVNITVRLTDAAAAAQAPGEESLRTNVKKHILIRELREIRDKILALCEIGDNKLRYCP
jgi:hypothetical protein